MRERGILMSGPMVRATVAGIKTQTRRVCKSQPFSNGYRFDGRDILCHEDFLPPSALLMKVKRRGETFNVSDVEGDLLFECPYGEADDRLWVREAWRSTGDGGRCNDMPPRELQPHPVWYEADGKAPASECVGKYRHARFMPRWASRIQLEVTGVRVERLQDISEADASAEGCERLMEDEPGYVFRDEPNWKLCPQCGGTRLFTSFGANLGACFDTDCEKCDTYKKRYRWLWESINGEGSWDANPFVWVVEFRRITPTQAAQQLSEGGAHA